jgi:bacteriocin biosynthesis cyclodehydratase domain-containing protein
MRPALKPGLLPVWRDRDTLQIGIDPRRAVALTGMADAAWVISLLDGSRDRAQVIAAARDRGMPAGLADRVLTLLAAGGALDDFPAGTYRVLSRQLRARLAPELAATSLAHGYGDGGARALARRCAAHVRVLGGGRLEPAITAILAASGIGQVDGGDARQAEPAPAEPPPARAAPARAGRARAGRGQPRGQPGRAQVTRPDLVVLVGVTDPELAARLMRDRIPHLAASASEAIGVVGPLVLPGRSACLRCLDLARTDRDPAWPLILAQLAGRQPDPPACDASLAAAVAAQAAAQALAFTDRPDQPGPVTNGTLELVLPGWQWRRRTWPPHPDCTCGRHSW